MSTGPPPVAETAPRGLLWRWLGWFGLVNAVLLMLISTVHLSGFRGGDSVLAWVYLVTIIVSHHAWLALLPLSLVAGTVITLWPRRRWVLATGVVLYAAMIALIVLDSLLWSQSRFHVNFLTAKILGWQSWVFVGVMFAIGLLFESVLAGRVWRRVTGSTRLGGRWVALLLTTCFLVAQFIYAWADASYYTPVTGVAQQLPVHRGFTAKKLLVRSGMVDIQQARERRLAERLSRGLDDAAARSLKYPLQPLRCPEDEPLNLLIVLLDAWRFDMLSDEVAPNLEHWARERAVRFDAHFSGGNSSRMGVFSFFYGLPPGYFQSFEAAQRPALLITEAQRRGARLGLFTSADMYRPVALDRTAFANVPNLRVTPENPDAPAWRRDRDMVQEWYGFLDSLDGAEPFLGFLFFDATNAQVFPPDYPVQFASDPNHPMARQWAAYQTAVHYDDGLVMAVLNDLRMRGLEERTVVVVSSDHGEEFMESGAGIDEHGSAYSRWQLQVPLLLAWPGMAPGVIAKRTSHYDVAPTLLGRVYGCANDPADYSSGADLFESGGWDWLLAGSYFNYAVLEPDQITVTFPNGLYEVRDWDYRVLPNPEFRSATLQAVMQENRRFYP